MINANIEENGHFALEEIQGIPDEPMNFMKWLLTKL